MALLRHPGWIWLAVIMLSACTDSDEVEVVSESQQYYFLESLAMVESAGRKLQSPSLTEEDLHKALTTMDDGLKLAFQVEAEFLQKFDPRLSKNYQRYFVKGVESYRLGIEAGDSEEQKQGLELLGDWSRFWSEEETRITDKMARK